MRQELSACLKVETVGSRDSGSIVGNFPTCKAANYRSNGLGEARQTTLELLHFGRIIKDVSDWKESCSRESELSELQTSIDAYTAIQY